MGLCRGMLFYRPERVEAPLAADGRRRPSNAQYGCWLSHKIVCANAAVLLERADDIPILVLEDDFRFLPSWTSAKRRHIQRVLRRYYLGHVPLYGGYPVLSRRWPFVRGSLWRLRPLMTHAYIVSARGRAQIAASTPMNHRRPCGFLWACSTRGVRLIWKRMDTCPVSSDSKVSTRPAAVSIPRSGSSIFIAATMRSSNGLRSFSSRPPSLLS